MFRSFERRNIYPAYWRVCPFLAYEQRSRSENRFHRERPMMTDRYFFGELYSERLKSQKMMFVTGIEDTTTLREWRTIQFENRA